MPNATILLGDARTRLADIPEQSVQCVITSPPYWGLRDYGKEEQIGLEQSPSEYVSELVKVFDEVWRVLKDDGVLWLNLGDSYANTGVKDSSKVGGFTGDRIRARLNGITNNDGGQDSRQRKIPIGLKPKDLVGIPWRVAFALQDAGWYLRQDIIWHKPNPMPESVSDRCTKAHEYLFLLSKSPRYFFDNKAIAEQAVTTSTGHRFDGNKYGDAEDDFFRTKGATYTATGTRNKRDVWTIPTKPFKGAHFAVMPEALVQPCVLASSTEGDTILDPFTGSGTVAVVALAHNRNFIGTELNPEYASIAEQRISTVNPMFNTVTINQQEKETK